eukprot:CAMPEP_0174902346 /NCGR_PEP_ID=MMETSP0167-20121228/37631_1 /TAXON_ID=38298 /ORGANISM="Rhodella maculata, Strain CCMP736" /LENGTH=53 /DNA_ID=CAMNT_0016144321 /DNA_START=102 /DNA_END=263 /DNA_ORIENTATION=+
MGEAALWARRVWLSGAGENPPPPINLARGLHSAPPHAQLKPSHVESGVDLTED